MNLKEMNELTVLKQCELCINYLNCIIYDKICENLLFLQNFLDIKESGETAKYCKKYNGYTPKESKIVREILVK